MTILKFPPNPTIGQEYDYPPYKYYWDGHKWKSRGVGYNPVNDLKDKLEPRIDELENDVTQLQSGNSSLILAINSLNERVALEEKDTKDWEGFTAELLAQADIVDNGQPDELGNSQRVNAINKMFVRSFGNTAEMLSCNSLIAGNKVSTAGFYDNSDLGGSVFFVTGFTDTSKAGMLDGETSSVYALDGKQLRMLPRDGGFFSTKQWGAKHDGVSDDHFAFQQCDLASDFFKVDMMISSGVATIADMFLYTGGKRYYGVLGATIKRHPNFTTNRPSGAPLANNKRFDTVGGYAAAANFEWIDVTFDEDNQDTPFGGGLSCMHASNVKISGLVGKNMKWHLVDLVACSNVTVDKCVGYGVPGQSFAMLQVDQAVLGSNNGVFADDVGCSNITFNDNVGTGYTRIGGGTPQSGMYHIHRDNHKVIHINHKLSNSCDYTLYCDPNMTSITDIRFVGGTCERGTVQGASAKAVWLPSKIQTLLVDTRSYQMNIGVHLQAETSGGLSGDVTIRGTSEFFINAGYVLENISTGNIDIISDTRGGTAADGKVLLKGCRNVKAKIITNGNNGTSVEVGTSSSGTTSNGVDVDIISSGGVDGVKCIDAGAQNVNFNQPTLNGTYSGAAINVNQNLTGVRVWLKGGHNTEATLAEAGGSVAAGGFATRTGAIAYGAVGSRIEASINANIAGLIVTATVTTFGNYQIVLYNPTSSPISIPAGTWSVKCYRL